MECKNCCQHTNTPQHFVFLIACYIRDPFQCNRLHDFYVLQSTDSNCTRIKPSEPVDHARLSDKSRKDCNVPSMLVEVFCTWNHLQALPFPKKSQRYLMINIGNQSHYLPRFEIRPIALLLFDKLTSVRRTDTQRKQIAVVILVMIRLNQVNI